ncbi:hypothetical protein [Aliagarivorans taiwanensis]|uniref:hypothetical protein n=1 Tax=Aliagarivorans taiwanensis TaxID=561966 RepID=UPI0003F8AB1C|nr:hypothetical protein [Aliagarivorans taiwanensis]
MRTQLLVLLCGGWITSINANASQYVPLQDEYLTARIEQLAVIASIPIISKPYSVEVIRAALDEIERDVPGLYFEINGLLSKYEEPYGLSYADVYAQMRSKSDSEPSDFLYGGEFSSSNLGGRAIAHYRFAPSLLLSLGGSWYQEGEDSFQPNYSYLSLGQPNLNMFVGYKDRNSSVMKLSRWFNSLYQVASPSVSFSSFQGVAKRYSPNIELGVRWLGEDSLSFSAAPEHRFFHFSIEPSKGWTLGGSIDDVKEGDYSELVFVENQRSYSLSSRFNFSVPVPVSVYGEHTVFEHERYETKGLSLGADLPLGAPLVWLQNVSLMVERQVWDSDNTDFELARMERSTLLPGYSGSSFYLGLGWQRDNYTRYDLGIESWNADEFGIDDQYKVALSRNWSIGEFLANLELSYEKQNNGDNAFATKLTLRY